MEELPRLIELTSRIKEDPRGYSSALAGKSVALIFEKHSTRTRVSLEVAVSSMGGHPLYLPKEQLQLGRGEPIEDTARVLSGMVDAIAYRAYSHETMLRLALNSDVPVINALDDEEHPLQALADVYTIQELKGRVRGLKVAFVGDGNNVMVSLMLAVASLGGDFWAAIPEGYDPPEEKVAIAEELASSAGGSVRIVRDPVEAVRDADVVYTDVWISMGQEAEREKRLRDFAPYRVDEKLVSHAKEDFIFMHCLPAHRGEEVTPGVIDGPHSVVWRQAWNRLHTAKAVLARLLAPGLVGAPFE